MPRPVARRLTLESLEARLAPANLLLTSIQLVDGNNAQITAPIVGQQVFYRASWSATGFSSSAQYVVRYTIDGVSVDSPVQNLGNGTFTWYRGITYASPGPHAVSITVDGAGAVAESSETDNTLTASFTPVLPSDLPQKFSFPVAGVPHRDYSINNYVDVDPRTGSRADFRGGPFQYDGHDAIDVGPAAFSDQDRGLPILAAAAGTVTAVTDGYFDRESSATGRPGNYVTLDHGNGWQTVYYHFAANTIVVQVGDVVTQNQLLGLMGSSGNSTGTHLHWSVYYRGANVETFYAPTSYWLAPPVYQGDAPPTVLRAGVSNYDVGPELGEGPSGVTEFPTSQSWNAYFWYHMSNYRPDSQVAITWYRPDGSVYTTFNQTPNFQQPSRWYWSIGTGWKSALGTWNVALTVDGVELDRQSFTVVSDGTAPEASLAQGSTYIVDDRLTPIDLGTVAAGASAPQQTFTITNRGAGPLTTSLVSLPAGFSLVGSFPSSVPANSSATFVVQLDTAVVGRKLGEVRIATNDSDEADYTFLVSGQVTGSLPTGTPVLSLPGPAVPTGFGKAPVVIDSGADVNDPDAVSWNGASLRGAILTNGSAADRLGVRHQGSGTGQVGVTGANLTYGGQTIASFSGGTGTTPLLITFTNLATLPAVRAVLRNLTYGNVSTTPDTRPRFLGFTFTDSTGKSSEQKVKRVTSTPTPLNDAPILTPALASDLPPADEDTTPTGITVASLLASSVIDADQLQAVGLAVTGSSGGFGTWQYSITGGSTWVPLGTVSTTSARLLPATARLRFLPEPDGFGTATLTYRAWDGTQGTAGTSVNLSAVAGGGQSAFSTASATSSAVIRPLNDLPSFTPGGDVLAQENSGDVSLTWASNISAGPANENQTVQFLLSVENLSLFQVDPALSPQGVLTFRPAPNTLGSTTITVQLLDSAGGITPGQTFTLTIAPLNDAPVLVPFARVLTSGAAFSVATLLGDSVSDADPDAVEGIAITGFSRTGGDWQYSTNGGAVWRTLSSASPASARLLRASDLLRFQSDFVHVGFGDLTFRAWDQTQGTAGGTANLTGPNAVGGFTPYSTAQASASLFLGKGLLGLVEDATPGNGGLVSQVLLRSDVADPDAGATQGVAIVGGTSGSAGQWEYQLAGSATWVPMPSLSPAAAWLLRSNDRLRFVPAPNWSGTFSLSYRFWDQTAGSAGGRADLSAPGATGGATSFSAELLTYRDLVDPLPDRPVLNPSPVELTSIPVGTATVPVEVVAALLAGRATDADGDALGLAVVAADGPGTWQFSTNGGSTWQTLGPVSPTAAQLLASSARLRFLPNSSYNADARPTLRYRAWDGSTTFSLDEATAFVAANHAPTLNIAPLVTLAPTAPIRVSTLLGSAVSDVDAGAKQGLAVVGATGAGTWQYSRNGGATWQQLILTSATSARLLVPQDLLRFLPRTAAPQGTLLYRAWDQSSGQPGQLGNTLAPGATAYSAAVETAIINRAPVLDPARIIPFPARNEGAGPGTGVAVSQLLGAAVTDNGVVAPRGLAIAGASVVVGGTWEVSFNGGATWETLGPVSASAARLLRSTDRIRFLAPVDFAGTVALSFRAWDQAAGTPGQRVQLALVGGATPFSAAVGTARLTIRAAPDRPQLAATPIDLPSTLPGQFSSVVSVQSLLGGASDPDVGTQLGLAIIGLTGGGTWQYSTTGGTTWSNVGTVTPEQALLLRSTDLVRLNPGGFIGVAGLSFRAWDRTAGTPGARFSSLGSAFSLASVTARLAVNRAPVLDTAATPTLPAILEDEPNPVGTSVATLLGSQSWDADAGALVGLAITGFTGGGTWQFSLDEGATWQPLGAVSPGAARLLRATDQVRFVPAVHFNGPATLSYVAWDQTAGTAGALASTLTAGGSAPFSPQTETASVTVTPVNDRPRLTPPSVATILPPLAPGTTNPPAFAVAQLLAGLFSDPDGADAAGVALVGLTGIVGGRWEFSLDGGATWTQFTAATPTAALLLRASDLLRFTPFNSFAGTSTLTYRAWDGTQGTAGSTQDVGTLADDAAFSVETNIVYLPVNTAPSLRI